MGALGVLGVLGAFCPFTELLPTGRMGELGAIGTPPPSALWCCGPDIGGRPMDRPIPKRVAGEAFKAGNTKAANKQT